MRRRTIGAAVTAAAIAATALLGSAGAGSAAETITAFVGQQKVRVADVGKPGPSPGDDLLVRVELFADEARSERLGSVRAACEQLDRNHLYCWNELTVDGRGDLTTEGTQDLRTPVVLDPITGGTGDFVGAVGTVTVDFSVGVLTISIV